MRERNETRDPAQESRSARSFKRSVVSPLGPGSRFARPDTSVRSRGARSDRWPSSYSRCQTAQCCSFPRRVVAPGLVFISSRPSPNGGVGGAPTGALFLLSRLRDATIHRGDFRPGAALPSPALPPDTYSELLAARSSCLAGGVPGSPCTVRRHPEMAAKDRKSVGQTII